jgi:ankyrin repeat protein
VVWQTDGRTPLYAASASGHVEVVRALVGAGAAVNQASVRDNWLTVLVWLCVGDGSQRVCALCACASLRVVNCLGDCDAHTVHVVVPSPYVLDRAC